MTFSNFTLNIYFYFKRSSKSFDFECGISQLFMKIRDFML